MSEAHRVMRNSVPASLPQDAERAANGRQPEPDLGDLNNRLGYFVRRLQVWIFHDFIRTLASVDVRPAQFSVLVVIEANPGLSQSDIADVLGIERARLVRLLDKLEKRGFLERRRSPSDRRTHAVYLTKDGQRRMKRIRRLADQHEARVAEKLGAQQRKTVLNVLRDVAP